MTEPRDLTEADFYVFFDWRSEDDQLKCQTDFDAWLTGEPSEETVRIQKGREEFLRQIDPSIRRADINAFSIMEIPLPPSLVHANSWFKSRMPARLDHYETIECPSIEPEEHRQISRGAGPRLYSDGMYLVVSLEWKEAIESVEPGVHQFFSHRMNFHDGSVDRYIFHERVRVEGCLRPEAMLIGQLEQANAAFRMKYYWLADADENVDVRVDCSKLSGKNWIRSHHGGYDRIIVSRSLALELANLIPQHSDLVPLKVETQ